MYKDIHFEVHLILKVNEPLTPEDDKALKHQVRTRLEEAALGPEDWTPVPSITNKARVTPNTYKTKGVEVISMSESTRYEYTTRCYPWSGRGLAEATVEKMLEDMGFRRAWADNTMEGIFVVYRREIKS
jgi:hypothetical protein